MRTHIFIDAFPVAASIGVFEWEKQVPQELVFDIEAYYDFSAAMASDDLAHTINYVELSGLVRDVTLRRHYDLLEHLAGEIARALMQRFALTELNLKISKPGAVPEANNVGIVLSCQPGDL